MAKTNAISAAGMALAVSIDGGTTYTSIAEIKKLDGPNMKGETKEATQMTSTGAAKEFVATLVDSGEISCDINFVPSVATTINGYFRHTYVWKITWPDGTKFISDGILTEFAPKGQVDGILEASIKVKLSGAPTIS